jgi:hypothetical protein
MSDSEQSGGTEAVTVDPAERIAQHLLRRPSDLIDSRRLMRFFHASVHDFQRALVRLEQLTLPVEEKATC